MDHTMSYKINWVIERIDFSAIVVQNISFIGKQIKKGKIAFREGYLCQQKVEINNEC